MTAAPRTSGRCVFYYNTRIVSDTYALWTHECCVRRLTTRIVHFGADLSLHRFVALLAEQHGLELPSFQCGVAGFSYAGSVRYE